ncbi:hypothetical protein Palpr_1377 [Paludibacter propionicigenes WB4]|uniref:Inner membrane protein YgaP-like transmembrane domain-containing protein n=1 Tax=Paludibacter propionicigenes (strain DSM 17365 / JCM 13257 / WB4) TaxID=694427 RepID=E4T479_PALPW|nr:DUF2892 domain-containing protein [Paludibacter propionicigenes]ADQ79523.1 hypothetical protein Palpr_1377 [Paludibacter propionicigenes WB4]
MKKNMSSYDKLIRLIVAIVLIVLYYRGILSGTLGIVALLVALVLTITSLLSFCPLYTLLGINTCKKENK